MKGKLLVISALVFGTLILIGSVWTGKTLAQADDFHQSIVDKLVERFNLNRDEVQTVFDEAHQEQQTQMRAHFEEKLNKAVENGELTEEQKQLILAKQEELKAEREADRESFQNMTQEERREAMQKRNDELKSWAEENGIDLKYLSGGFGMRGGHPGGMKDGLGKGPGFGEP